MFGGLFYGYNIGNGASILLPLKKDFPHLSSLFISLIPSSLLLGASLGSFCTGPLVKKFGFRLCIFFLSLFSSLFALASVACPIHISSSSTSSSSSLIFSYMFFSLLVFLRFLMGFCTGVSTTACPMFVAEVSPKQYRGALGAIWKLGATSGTLTGFTSGFVFTHLHLFSNSTTATTTNTFSVASTSTALALLNETLLSNEWQWKCIMGLSLVWSLVLFVVFLIMPESPVWREEHGKQVNQNNNDTSLNNNSENTMDSTQVPLVEVQQDNENNQINSIIVGNEDNIEVVEENEKDTVPLANASQDAELIATSSEENSLPNHVASTASSTTPIADVAATITSTTTTTSSTSMLGNIKLLFNSRENIKLFALGVILAINFRLTGIWAFLLFTPSIFQAAGFNGVIGDLAATIGVGIFNVVTKLSSILLVDCMGRRPLLLFGNVSTIITTTLYGLNVQFNTSQPAQGYVSVVIIAVFFIGFNAGIGSLVLLLFNELFKDKHQSLRGLAVGILTALTWIFSFASGILFLPFIEVFGQAVLFWLFSACTLFVTVILFIWMPETKHVKK